MLKERLEEGFEQTHRENDEEGSRSAERRTTGNKMTGSHTRPPPAYLAAPLRRNQSVCRLGPALGCMTRPRHQGRKGAGGQRSCSTGRVVFNVIMAIKVLTFRSDGFLVRFLRKELRESHAAHLRQHLQPPVQHLRPTSVGVRQPQASSPSVNNRRWRRMTQNRGHTTSGSVRISEDQHDKKTRNKTRHSRMAPPRRQLCRCG